MAIRPTISAYGGGTQQFPVFLNKALVGYQFEKTERDLMRTINSNVARSQQKRINLQAADGTEIANVVGARKHSNANAIGGDSLTDVSIFTTSGRQYKVNTKGTIAPVQIHNDFKSVFASSPILAKRFARAAIQKYKSLGFKDGAVNQGNVPGVYAELRGENNMRVCRGTPQMGGPVDYYYEGATLGEFDEEQNMLRMQGSFTSSSQLAKTQNFYVSMVEPPTGSRFMFTKQDNYGVPIIHDQGGRALSIVDRQFVPANSVVIRI